MLSHALTHRLAPRAALVALLAALITAGAASASSYTITLDGTPLVVTTTTSAEKATVSFTGTRETGSACGCRRRPSPTTR